MPTKLHEMGEFAAQHVLFVKARFCSFPQPFWHLVACSIFHVIDFPLFPPYISDLTQITHLSTTWDTSDCFRFFLRSSLSSEIVALMFNTTLTFFCPTREAFASFNNEDFNRLLDPIWIRHAAEFVLNHMHAGAKTQEELAEWADSGQDTITMLNGATYEFSASFGVPRIKNVVKNETAHVEFGNLVGLDG